MQSRSELRGGHGPQNQTPRLQGRFWIPSDALRLRDTRHKGEPPPDLGSISGKICDVAA